MALDQIFEKIATDGTVAGSLWAENRLDSPLVSLPLDRAVDGLTIVRSTITLRTRFREDVDINDRFRGQDGRVWHVNELSELGRRRWLDVSVTNYQADGYVPPVDPPVDPTDPTDMQPAGARVILPADAQKGWGVLYPNGNSVSRVTVATAIQEVFGGGSLVIHYGTFATIEGVTGALATTTAGYQSWSGTAERGSVFGRVVATGQTCVLQPWPRTGSISAADYSIYRGFTAFVTGDPFIGDTTFNLLATAQIDLLTAAEAQAYVDSF